MSAPNFELTRRVMLAGMLGSVLAPGRVAAMPRVTPDMTAAAQERVVRPLLLMSAYFDSGTSRTWTGRGDLVVAGETFVGTGELLAISEIEETAELRAAGLTLTLGAVPLNMVQTALEEDYQGRQLDVVFAMLDEAGTVIPDPSTLFRGRMDVMTIEEGPEDATISLSAESRLIDFDRVQSPRYTAAGQETLFPGDKGFDAVVDIQEIDIPWGYR